MDGWMEGRNERGRNERGRKESVTVALVYKEQNKPKGNKTNGKINNSGYQKRAI
jgi:hypothetical protein